MHYAPPQHLAGYYSNLSGRRKALCIGINYTGTSSALRGCHADAENMSAFLCKTYGYRQEDIVMLLDQPGANYMSIPTRDNMIRAMQWLVKDARPNDSLFFHYSVSRRGPVSTAALEPAGVLPQSARAAGG